MFEFLKSGIVSSSEKYLRILVNILSVFAEVEFFIDFIVFLTSSAVACWKFVSIYWSCLGFLSVVNKFLFMLLALSVSSAKFEKKKLIEMVS